VAKKVVQNMTLIKLVAALNDIDLPILAIIMSVLALIEEMMKGENLSGNICNTKKGP